MRHSNNFERTLVAPDSNGHAVAAAFSSRAGKRWYDRTFMAREAFIALYHEHFYRMRIWYFAGSHVSFLNGSLDSYRKQVLQNRDAPLIMRVDMFQTEMRLPA